MLNKSSATSAQGDPQVAAPESFLCKYVFSTDHKVVGIQYFFLALFSVIAALVVFTALGDPALAAAMVAGVAGGIALGWFGVRHAQFESTPEGRFDRAHRHGDTNELVIRARGLEIGASRRARRR